MGKVKVTKEVATAFEYVRTKHSDDSLIRTTLCKQWNWKVDVLNYVGIETLVSMIYYGYDYSLTPEEKLAEKYQAHAENATFYKGKRNLDDCEREQERYSSGYIAGINEVLVTLGRTIKGVNA